MVLRVHVGEMLTRCCRVLNREMVPYIVQENAQLQGISWRIFERSRGKAVQNTLLNTSH